MFNNSSNNYGDKITQTPILPSVFNTNISPLIFDVIFNGPLQSHFLIPTPQSRNELGLMEIISMQPNPVNIVYMNT